LQQHEEKKSKKPQQKKTMKNDKNNIPRDSKRKYGFLETETRPYWLRIFDTPSLDRLPTGQRHYRPD
jgi:hypothetical protein